MRRLPLAMLFVLIALPAGAAERWETLPPTPAPIQGKLSGHADANGIYVNPIAQVTVYNDTGGGGSGPETTSYSYTYAQSGGSDTNQVLEIDTTLPSVSERPGTKSSAGARAMPISYARGDG